MSPRRKNKIISPRSEFSQNAIFKILIIIGLLCMSIATQWQAHEKAKYSFAKTAFAEKEATHRAPKPTFVYIPSVQIALPVSETQIKHNIWEISKEGASHLTTSANPTESNTIILYSHNTNDRFGPIRWMKINDIIRITTENGLVHEYTVVETMTVKPTEVDVLSSHDNEMLILYTCDGFADRMRFVLKAVPLNN